MNHRSLRGRALQKSPRIIKTFGEDMSRPISERELTRRILAARLTERVVLPSWLSTWKDGVRESTSTFRVVGAWPFYDDASHAVSEAGTIQKLRRYRERSGPINVAEPTHNL